MDVKNKRIECCWPQSFNASILRMCYTIQTLLYCECSTSFFQKQAAIYTKNSNLPPHMGRKGIAL